MNNPPNQSRLYQTIGNGDSSSDRCLISTPCLYVLDCGCWCELAGQMKMNFGAVCGKYIILAEIVLQSTDTCPIQQKNNAVNRLLKIQFGIENEIYRIQINRMAIADPITLEDCSIAEEILSSKDQMYIFIPDLHMCQGESDICDFHNARFGGSRILAQFLRECKRAGFTTVQTGDMFDLWMAEASVYNYYKPTDRDDLYRLSGRSERLARAAQRILDKVHQSKYRRYIEQSLSLIDHYILGNHDWELQFAECKPLAQFIERFGIKIHNKLTPWHGTSKERIERFHVFHGHQYDDYNNTEKSNDTNSAMKIEGKPITFSFARYLRQTIAKGNPETKEFYVIKNQEMILDGSIEERQPYMYIDEQQIGNNDPMRDPDDRTYKGQLMEEIGSVLNIDPIIEIGEAGNFGDTRNNIIKDVASRLNAFNYQNSIDVRYIKPSGDAFLDSERTIEWSIQKSASISKPIDPSNIRVVIHSHTHHALLTRIILKHAGI